MLSVHSAIFLQGKGAEATAGDYMSAFVDWLIRYLVYFTPVLITLTIADNIPLTGIKRVGVLALALVIGAQLSWPIRCTYEASTVNGCQHLPEAPLRAWLKMWLEGT